VPLVPCTAGPMSMRYTLAVITNHRWLSGYWAGDVIPFDETFGGVGEEEIVAEYHIAFGC